MEPSGSSVAPALKTLFMEYGQSLPLRIGLPACRRKRVSYFASVGLTKIFVAVIETPFSWDCGFQKVSSDGGSKIVCGAAGFFQLAHFQERHQERQSRFSSLIFVGAVGMQAVAATTGGRIV